jgi:hypothetical protein
MELQTPPKVMIKDKLYYQIEVPKSIKQKELNAMTWQSLMFYHLLRKKRVTQGVEYNFINIPSSQLQDLYGKTYSKHIKDLEKRGWIEVNNRYKNAKDGFTKSYRLGSKNFIYTQDHKKFPLPLIKSVWDRFAPHFSQDQSEVTDDYLQLIKQRHDTLFIPNIPLSIVGKLLKTKLDKKRACVRRKAHNRIYSTIINSPKKARTDVVFGEQGKLVNIDVTGMIHQLLNRTIKDKKWNKWIEEDFPMKVIKSLRLYKNRNAMKKLIIKAYSKGSFQQPVPKIRSFLKQEFPEIMAYVDELNAISTVQGETQEMEAELIRNFIMRYQGYQMIPAHDGVFCGEKDAHEIQSALRKFLKSKGLVGATKMTPEVKYVPPPTPAEILTRLFS